MNKLPTFHAQQMKIGSDITYGSKQVRVFEMPHWISKELRRDIIEASELVYRQIQKDGGPLHAPTNHYRPSLERLPLSTMFSHNEDASITYSFKPRECAIRMAFAKWDQQKRIERDGAEVASVIG